MKKREIEIAPSLICCDLCRTLDSVRQLEGLGIKRLHVDILDGHFSPSMPIGLDMVKQLRKQTSLLFDFHLMTTRNEWFVEEALKIGASRICFHLESEPHPEQLLKHIRQSGVEAGLALSPAIRPETLEYLTDDLDFVLIMLITPGYAGHASEGIRPEAVAKVAKCRQWLGDHGKDIPILVDGRVSHQLVTELVAAGADSFVAGSRCLFVPGENLADMLDKTQAAIARGLDFQKREME